MKWFRCSLLIISFSLIIGMIVPASLGLFFNPEGGFSIGGVHVSVDQTQVTIEPGDTAVFTILIANDSDFPVFINATVVSLSQWKTHLEPQFIILKPHRTHTISLSITAPDNAANGTNAEVTIFYVVSSPTIDDTMDVPFTRVNTIVQEKDSNVNILSAVIVASTAIGLVALFTTDTGKYLGSVAISPLYSRIHKDKVLENTIRNDIFNFIGKNPGQNFSQIKREMQLKNGVLAHHLKTLEREHYIKSRKDGLYRRFFLRHQPVPNIFLNESQKQILQYLLNHPGASQSQVALKLGVSRQTVNYHVLSMEQQGAIRIMRNGRSASCFAVVRPGPKGHVIPGQAK